uniref:Putative secreted protein ovary overexpressed n=1 Tax=Rhipicephalus microplus TaxID=6941 RepID=A0A6M2D9Y2_RHIMP
MFCFFFFFFSKVDSFFLFHSSLHICVCELVRTEATKMSEKKITAWPTTLEVNLGCRSYRLWAPIPDPYLRSAMQLSSPLLSAATTETVPSTWPRKV